MRREKEAMSLYHMANEIEHENATNLTINYFQW